MRKIFVISLSLLLLVTIAGCSSTAKKPNPAENNNNVAKKNIKNEAADKTVQELTASEHRVMANRLSKLAEDVNGVEKATVVISTNTTSADNSEIFSNTGTSTENDNMTKAGNDTGLTNNSNPKTNNDPAASNRPIPENNTTTIPQTNNKAANNDNTTGINEINPRNNSQVGDFEAARNTGLVVMVGLTLNSKVDTNTMNNPAVNNNIDNTKAKTDTNANEIIRQVVQKIKASDSNIAEVLVTTDHGMIQNITDVAAGIVDGKPIKTFENDINDLYSKIKRDMPNL